MIRLVKNSAVVFTLAMFIALIFPSLATFTSKLVIPLLAVIMTLSLAEIDFKNFNVRTSLLNLGLNYGFLSGIILLLSFLLVKDEMLKLGFVVMAAAPPAIAIVPFSKLLRGNVTESILSSGFAYILSLLFTPAVIILFTGKKVDVMAIVEALVLLIIIPLLVSRFLRFRESDALRSAINLGFGIVVYSIVGVNAHVFFEVDKITEVIFVGFARTFLIGTLTFLVFLRFGHRFALTKTLFASYKNLGFTAGVSILLFGDKAAIPAAVCVIFEVLLFSYLSVIEKLSQIKYF